MEKVQGRSYTSNHVKLLKHLDKLKIIQTGGIPSPVMVHISICNPCNLTCSFCCFANRAMKEILPLDEVKKALNAFALLGATGVEFTGGGEPTLHPHFDEIVEHAHKLGFKIGVCTNGTRLKQIKSWDKFSWVRLGMYGFDEGYEYELEYLRKYPQVKISAAYVWDGDLATSQNPNVTGQWADNVGRKLSTTNQKEENFLRMLDWVEKEQIPTRIAFNAIKDTSIVMQNINRIRGIIEDKDLKFAFLSDFNYKGERRNNHCYMHMVKPFVFTDGNVYVCPSSELSLENSYNMNSQFRLCNIDGILDFYNQGVTRRLHDCKFCKYAMQNELIDDILMETENNEFA